MEDQGDRAAPTSDIGIKDEKDTVHEETCSRVDGAHHLVDQDLEMPQLRTDALDENTRSLDASQSNDGSRRRRKHKKHRHRHRDDVDDGDATGGGDVGNSEDNEDDSSGDGGNVVVSSSIRKKRPKSGRHHKQKHNATNGEPDDSGLSLGNSLNDTSIRDATQNNTESAGGNVDKEKDERHTNPAHDNSQGALDVTNNGADVVVPAAEMNSAPDKQGAASEKRPTEETHKQSYATPPEKEGDRTAPPNEGRKDEVVKEVRKAARHHRKLVRQKTQYELEKAALKKRLDDTKNKFQEEISKYEKDLSEQRQQYLNQLTELRLQEQYDSLSVRFTDLTELEEELDRRFEECVQRQVEIEEFERFLNIREELCKNKESDLIKLDDELDAWQGELDIKKRQLELEDRKGPRTQTTANTSFVKPTTDEEDYILKANLRKCQNDLTQAEENNVAITRECQEMKKQLECVQLDRRKQEQKIKQLESQLAIALSQLNNNKQSNNHKALPPINGHSTTSFRRADDKASERSHIMLQRLNASAELSINQEAAIRRKLAGKDARPAGSSSAKSSRSNPRDGGTAPRHQSMSTGSSHSGEGGSTTQSPGASIMIGSPKSSPSSSGLNGTDHDHAADKSTVCLIM